MILEVKNLTKEYIQGDEVTRVLDDVNLSVTKGEFIIITGRSGSGKTTLLNIMAGLTFPSSGKVLFSGQDIFSLTDKELSAFRNSKIGFIPQISSVLSNLTVLDNVRLPFFLMKRQGDPTDEAMKILGMLGIEKLAEKLPKRLSGGQLKRVAIARAMINKPDFILADEPTSDLDDQTAMEIIKVFTELAGNGTGIIMITHDLEILGHANKQYNLIGGHLT